MVEAAQAEAGQATDAGRRFEKTKDRQLFWTLSLYVDRAAVEGLLGKTPAAKQLRTFQATYRDSLRLRDAMEPLFNDIADRERQGAVDDFLLATLCAGDGEDFAIEGPDHVKWSTEGKTFIATPPDLARNRTTRIRRFWYAHLNGAFSYHISFRVDYLHTVGDFYFLSLLQKVAAPKEFTVATRDTPWRPTETGSRLFPAENIHLVDGAGRRDTFWRTIERLFNADAQDLFADLAKAVGAAQPTAGMTFSQLVSHAPFIEVPGLEMPLSRSLFFFRDKRLFDRLLPPIDTETGKRPSRSLLVQEECYAPYTARIQALIDALPQDAPQEVSLESTYWTWVNTRPEYTAADIARLKPSKPAIEPGRADCLQYLFLSGFNQNIIDFMNQDASEVLDSTDPIYPTDAQADETFFVRYANPRALLTYVQGSRSLETGNDYIGTCPYAFLIHVVSLHNEFLARDYEEKTFTLVDAVRKLNDKRKFNAAALEFYEFRMSTYSDFLRFRYGNIFRYDTERDVFETLEELRGTTRKGEFLETLVNNTESQTRDLEARVSKGDEGRVALGLGALGLFGFFQLMFQWGTELTARGAKAGDYDIGPGVTTAALWLSAGFTVVLLLYVIYVIVKKLDR